MGSNTVQIWSLLVLGLWIWIVWAVGKAAKKKGRSRLIWSVLTVFPLGPIFCPLWLKTMPQTGEKATTGQAIGRGVLISFLIINALIRLGTSSLEQNRLDEMSEAAKDDYGFETQSVTEHYKKMSVDELAQCLSLSKEMEDLEAKGELNTDTDTWLFQTQRQADLFNVILATYNKIECGDRTYDTADLEIAMKNLESERSASEIDPSTAQTNLSSRLSEIANFINRDSPAAFDQITRLEHAELATDASLVFFLTMKEYEASEISQDDLRDFLLPDLVERVCSDELLLSAFNLGGSVTYRYDGADSSYIGELSLSSRDC